MYRGPNTHSIITYKINSFSKRLEKLLRIMKYVSSKRYLLTRNNFRTTPRPQNSGRLWMIIITWWYWWDWNKMKKYRTRMNRFLTSVPTTVATRGRCRPQTCGCRWLSSTHTHVVRYTNHLSPTKLVFIIIIITIYNY